MEGGELGTDIGDKIAGDLKSLYGDVGCYRCKCKVELDDTIKGEYSARIYTCFKNTGDQYS